MVMAIIGGAALTPVYGQDLRRDERECRLQCAMCMLLGVALYAWSEHVQRRHT